MTYVFPGLPESPGPLCTWQSFACFATLLCCMCLAGRRLVCAHTSLGPHFLVADMHGDATADLVHTPVRPSIAHRQNQLPGDSQGFSL